MNDLFDTLAKNGHARDNVTLEHVIANTAQDLAVLMKYIEYQKSTIGNLKLRFLMKDSSW